MGDKRKLLAEVERTMKKVDEGVELFDEIWQKVHDATTPALKDKYEQDLKKEIKKLQRLRDQIKSWISAGNDIRDKDGLVDKRKLIESKMEAFKEVERETKTKNYSKEGLLNSRLDPREKEKQEIREWVQEGLESMAQAAELFEAERDELALVLRKKKSDKAKQTKLEKTLECAEAIKFHTRKFEGLLRMLDNDLLDVDAVKDIKDDFEAFLTELKEGECKDINYIYDALTIEDIPEISNEGGKGAEDGAVMEAPSTALNKDNISLLNNAATAATSTVPLAIVGGVFVPNSVVAGNAAVPFRERPKLSERESLNSSTSAALIALSSTIAAKDAALPVTRGSTSSSTSTSPSPPPGNVLSASVDAGGASTHAFVAHNTVRRKSGSHDHDQLQPSLRTAPVAVHQGKTFATFSSALTGASGAVPPAPKTPFGMPGGGIVKNNAAPSSSSVIHGYAAVAAQGVPVNKMLQQQQQQQQQQQHQTMPTLAQVAASAAANAHHAPPFTKQAPSPYAANKQPTVIHSSASNDISRRTPTLVSDAVTGALVIPATAPDSFLIEHNKQSLSSLSHHQQQPPSFSAVVSSGLPQTSSSNAPLDTAPTLHATALLASRRASIPDKSSTFSSNFANSAAPSAAHDGSMVNSNVFSEPTLRHLSVASPGSQHQQQAASTLSTTAPATSVSDYLQQHPLHTLTVSAANSAFSLTNGNNYAGMKPELAAALLAAKYSTNNNNSAINAQANAEASAAALAQAFAQQQQQTNAAAAQQYNNNKMTADALARKQPTDAADAGVVNNNNSNSNLAAARVLQQQQEQHQQLLARQRQNMERHHDAPQQHQPAVNADGLSPTNNANSTGRHQQQHPAASSALSPASTSSSSSLATTSAATAAAIAAAAAAASVTAANSMLTSQREYLAAKKSADPQSLRITASQAINPLGMTQPDKDLIVQHSLIDSAINNLPSNSDLDRMRPLPRMPTPVSTTYTKQVPLMLQAMKWYEETAENATLFWVFYMCPGTLAQYMAAYALKQKAWRYHTKLRAWFQRLEEPKLIMQDYEKGNFRYFDVEMWKEQIKKDFVFEYTYLEDYRLDIADPYSPPRYVIPLMDSMAAPLPASSSNAGAAMASSGNLNATTGSTIFATTGGAMP